MQLDRVADRPRRDRQRSVASDRAAWSAQPAAGAAGSGAGRGSGRAAMAAANASGTSDHDRVLVGQRRQAGQHAGGGDPRVADGRARRGAQRRPDRRQLEHDAAGSRPPGCPTARSAPGTPRRAPSRPAPTVAPNASSATSPISPTRPSRCTACAIRSGCIAVLPPGLVAVDQVDQRPGNTGSRAGNRPSARASRRRRARPVPVS